MSSRNLAAEKNKQKATSSAFLHTAPTHIPRKRISSSEEVVPLAATSYASFREPPSNFSWLQSTPGPISRQNTVGACVGAFREGRMNSLRRLGVTKGDYLPLQVLTWNVAAPNSNPFEYWATHENEDYVALMTDVQRCLDSPGQHDVPLSQIFTPRMFEELTSELKALGIQNLESLKLIWENELSGRKAITEYLKDQSLGEKRLISMPDRMTSSLKTPRGEILFRPSPISGSQEEMGMILSLDFSLQHRTELLFSTNQGIPPPGGLFGSVSCLRPL